MTYADLVQRLERNPSPHARKCLMYARLLAGQSESLPPLNVRICKLEVDDNGTVASRFHEPVLTAYSPGSEIQADTEPSYALELASQAVINLVELKQALAEEWREKRGRNAAEVTPEIAIWNCYDDEKPLTNIPESFMTQAAKDVYMLETE